MGQSPFWRGVTNVLSGGAGAIINAGRDKKIDQSVADQKVALDKAQGYQQENLDYIKQQNAGTANLGDAYLGWLVEGINSGAFKNDPSLVNAFKQYAPQQFQQQQIDGSQEYRFNGDAPQYNGPTQFMQYNQQQQQVQAPQAFQYDQQQPGQFQFNGEGQQQVSFNQQRQDAGQFQADQGQQYQAPGQFQYDRQAPEDMQWNQQRQDAGQFQTQPWQNTTFNGQKYNENIQQYRGQQAPQQRQITDQFQTQQYTPDQRRPNAPQAQYFDPNAQQYKGKEFSIQDDPVYQRRLQQSQKAIENSAAAQGMQLSGANLKALQENAQGIASEEGQAAYDRWNQQDQTGYNRFQDQQNATSDAMRYKNQDQYGRYLDQNSQFESDRGFGASQNDTAFSREMVGKNLGAQLNQDEFNRYLQGDKNRYSQFADQRNLQLDQSNRNADRDWQQYTYEKGFGRDVYADDRNFEYQQNQDLQNRYDINYQQDFANQLAMQQNRQQNYQQNYQNAYNAGRDNVNDQLNAYNINNANRIDSRNFMYGQNQDQQNRYDTQYQQDFANQMAMQGANNDIRQQNFANQLAAYGANTGQYNINRNFAYGANQDQFANQMTAANFNAGQGNQYFQNALAAQQANFGNNLDLYGAQVGQYNNNRQFGADQYQQNWANNFAAQNANQQNAWNQYQYGTNLGYQMNNDQYGRLVDQYNRGAAEKQNQYTRIGDVIGYGQQAKQNNVNAMSNFSDASSDLAIQYGNAQAAAAAQKNEKKTVLGTFGL